MKYLVTTNADRIPKDMLVAMVDGTTPGWIPKLGDRHYDHHRPGGKKVQLDEIPDHDLLEEEDEWCLVTTQVDADACAAAAWLQLNKAKISVDSERRMRAIALDCDYLCIPPDEEAYADLAEFAAKAVAELKSSGFALAHEMDLPSDRKAWSAEMKEAYASEGFKQGTEWLIAAAKGDRPWPGESGAADAYFAEMQRDIEAIRQLKMIRLMAGVAIFDQRSAGKYVDPRCLVAIAQELGATKPITLSIRAAQNLLGSSYTLGSLPYHPAAAKLDLTQVFPILSEMERDRRQKLGLPEISESWGGRATVGGSGWNQASLLMPEDIIEAALKIIR